MQAKYNPFFQSFSTYYQRLQFCIYDVYKFFLRIGAASAPWVIEGLKLYSVIIPFSLMGGLTFIGALSCIALKETNGLATQETLGQDDAKTDQDAETSGLKANEDGGNTQKTKDNDMRI